MNDLEQTAIERMKAVPDMSQRLFEKPLGSPTPEGNARGENPMRYIASISYGKDSLAQLEIIYSHGLPLTDIVTADVMATPTIPAYLPELVEFRERMDSEIKKRYGIQVTHVRSDLTFVDLFYRKLTERSKYTGIYGWPPMFGHWCMTHLKKKPIQQYFHGIDCVEWIGIAVDEPERHAQLNERKRSALVEYGITESAAMGICKNLNWVSPTYLHAGRDGCWFCPCQGVASLRRLYNEFPEYWEMMMDWDADTEKRFKVDHTLADYDRRFRMEAEGLLSSDDKNFRWSMLDGPLQMRLF